MNRRVLLAPILVSGVLVGATSLPALAVTPGYSQTNLVTDNQVALASAGFAPAAHTPTRTSSTRGESR